MSGELGYPPLVTPSSQIVGTQAVMNVLTGERYKVVLKEVKNYLKGLYGKPPGKWIRTCSKASRRKNLPGPAGRPARAAAENQEEMKTACRVRKISVLHSFSAGSHGFLSKRPSGTRPPVQRDAPCQPFKNKNASLRLDKLYTVDENLLTRKT